MTEANSPIPTTSLPSGEAVPILGQGTWGMGESAAAARRSVAALQRGIDLGMTLIDTAEMYADGGAETLVGEAIAGRRDQVFLVSKVLPSNASRRGTLAACDASLRRLATDRIDLYLLHWRGSIPLEETVAAFDHLVQAGKIRHWGVSNLDLDDMNELCAIPGGAQVATDQVLYNLTRRGIEFDLLPWCRSRGIPVMCYSPIEQGRLLGHRTIREIAKRHGAAPAQIALAWLLQQEGLIVIPKADTESHLRENRQALEIRLSDADLATLDGAFPPPARRRPLEML